LNNVAALCSRIKAAYGLRDRVELKKYDIENAAQSVSRVGLVVEALCLLGRGPISFLIFSRLGGGLVLAGIGYYLLALV